MYSYEEFSTIYDENKTKFEQAYRERFTTICTCFNGLSQLSNDYTHIRTAYGFGKHQEIMISTVFKSLTNLYTVIDLTAQGNVGASRIIIRNIFEFLNLGKFVLLYDDKEVQRKWENQETINLDRRIFKKIKSKNENNKREYIEFWATLCRFTHATNISGQVYFQYESMAREIDFNFLIIQLLMCMLYHFINTKLATPYIKQYVKQHLSRGGILERINNINAQVNTIVTKTFYLSFNKVLKSIYKFYCSQWAFV